MERTRLLGVLAVLVIALGAIGSLLTLGHTLTETHTTAVVPTTGIVLLSICGAVALGVRSSVVRSTPYW
ncbi:hypothetical protein [Halocatena halophila]|uniref:hypothetical protein n=1 Tax=Halocatena halophila TaxID=2814576 RepID=UPI002ED1A2D7